jgi:hypothetical protein
MSGNVRIVQLPWHWHSMAADCNSLQLINERIVGRNGLLNHARVMAMSVTPTCNKSWRRIFHRRALAKTAGRRDRFRRHKGAEDFRIFRRRSSAQRFNYFFPVFAPIGLQRGNEICSQFLAQVNAV